MKEKPENYVHITYVIVLILLTAIGTFFICSKTMKKFAASEEFWHEYSIRADKYIDAIYECDCDAIYDVAMETDAYDLYQEYYERAH